MSKKRQHIWLTHYTFELLSKRQSDGDFTDRFEVLAQRDEQAWAAVSARVGGCNPPIHTIRLLGKVWLKDLSDAGVLELLKGMDTV